MSKLRAYLVLMRPPNLLTALADIMAGFAASAALHHAIGTNTFDFIQHDLPWSALGSIGLASMCLYGGGVVLNDYFDTEIDLVERPERPIPAGKVSKLQALRLGATLLLMGVSLAFLTSIYSGIIAFVITVLVVSYDARAKHHPFFGPLNMGLCRGANLLLGISIFPEHLGSLGFLVIIPIIYITAITMVSRGEVHGGSRITYYMAFSLYLLTAAMILSLGLLDMFSVGQSIFYLVLLLAMVIPPLYKARSGDNPALIGKAVKFGVLGLVLLDATIASGFAGWFFGLLLLLLLPFSILLAKSFAVT